MIYIAILLTFLFVWVLAGALLIKVFDRSKPIDKLKYFDEDYAIREKSEHQGKKKVSILKILSGLVPSLKSKRRDTRKLEEELMKADMPITVEELLVVKMLSSSAFAFLAFALSKDYLITAAVFIIVWNIPRFIISRRKKEKIKQFDDQLNEGIIVISNSLKAGYSFLQAIAVTSEEIKDPFSKEFKKLLKEMSLGIPEGEAMRNLLSRVESEDLRLVINAILIQKDIGGNLSEILDNIGETIRERQKIKDELKTLTAQGKLSGVIVILIPFFLGAAFYLLNKEYIMLLFTTPLGIGMLCLAIVNQIIGVLVIRKIINIDM